MTHGWLKAAFFATALTVAVTPAYAAGDTIKIGVPGAHSGDLVSYGMPSLQAVRLVAEEFNANGGVLGKKVEVIAQDDQCKPELATNAATKLLSEGVDVVMGAICSGATKAALTIYNDAKIVSISPSATLPDLTKSGENPYFFRTIASDDEQGQLAAAFIRDKLHAKSVALLHDKGDYGRGFTNYAREVLEKSGIKIALAEGITPGAVDYSAIIQKVRQSKADAVIFGGYHPEAAKLVQQMRKRRVQVPFISDDGIKDIAFLKVAGKEAEGMVYATGPQDVSTLPENIRMRKLYTDQYNTTPGNFYDNAVAATVALLTAIQRAGTTDTDKVMEALRTEYVDTPLGKIRFDKNGDAEGIGFAVYKVEKGNFVVQ